MYIDQIRWKGVKTHQEGLKLKTMFNELTCSNEGSSSTMDNTSGAYNDYVNKVSEIVFS